MKSADLSQQSLVRSVTQTAVGRAILSLPIRYFDATLAHAERIPTEGGVLLVSNHAMLGLDGVVLGALVFRETGRYIRFLGEKNLWRLPLVRSALDTLGVIPGTPDTATNLLKHGDLCAVYPGGIDDSWKLTETQRYRLQWGDRRGFARVAMRAQVPIVPIAGLGIDDMYDVIARERWVGRRVLGSARYDLPLALGWGGTLIPKRVSQRFVVLPPIDTRGDSNDPAAVESVRKQTFEALDTVLATFRSKS